MYNSLKLILITFILAFLVYVIFNLKKGKLGVKAALTWIVMSLTIVISIIFVDEWTKFAQAIGVKTFSNLMFFFGFIYLIFVCFNLMRTNIKQEKNIRKMTQKIAVLEQKIDKKVKSGRNKKSN